MDTSLFIPVIKMLKAVSVENSVARTLDTMEDVPNAIKLLFVELTAKLNVDGNPTITVELNCPNCVLVFVAKDVENVESMRVFADKMAARATFVDAMTAMDEFCKMLNVD